MVDQGFREKIYVTNYNVSEEVEQVELWNTEVCFHRKEGQKCTNKPKPNKPESDENSSVRIHLENNHQDYNIIPRDYILHLKKAPSKGLKKDELKERLKGAEIERDSGDDDGDNFGDDGSYNSGSNFGDDTTNSLPGLGAMPSSTNDFGANDNESEISSDDFGDGTTNSDDATAKKERAIKHIRNDLKGLIDRNLVEDVSPGENIQDTNRWFQNIDIHALLEHYTNNILLVKSNRNGGKFDTFIEMNVSYENIKEVLQTKMNNSPHIIVLNHGNAHWQLLISRNLLTNEQLEGQNLRPDFESPWYNTLKKMGMNQLEMYFVLQNDADGNCGPHILFQILQILQILQQSDESVYLTNDGFGVLLEDTNFESEPEFDAGF